MVTLCALSDILIVHVYKVAEFYFLESPLIKLLLLNGGKTMQINSLFSSRNDKGEFEMLFEEWLAFPRNTSVMTTFFLSYPIIICSRIQMLLIYNIFHDEINQ